MNSTIGCLGGAAYSGLFETSLDRRTRRSSGWGEIGSGTGTGELLGLRVRAAVRELEDVIGEAEQPNWDGVGAPAIDSEAYARGLAFLNAIPSTVRLPAIAVDPDGDLNFEWIASREWRVAVSLDDRNVVNFAAMFGKNLLHGTEDFSGDLPESVWRALQRIFARQAE